MIPIDNQYPAIAGKVDSALFETFLSFFPQQNSRLFLKTCVLLKDVFLPYFLHKFDSHGLRILTYMKNGKDIPSIVSPIGFSLFLEKENIIYVVYLKRTVYPQHTPYYLHILKMVMRLLLNSHGNGIMVHGSSLEKAGYGFSFIGPSGSGKTTVAGMLHPDRILSDDITIIRRTNPGYKIYANPWWNFSMYKKSVFSSQPIRLSASFFIKKASQTAINRLNCNDALKALILGDKYFQQLDFFDTKSGLNKFYMFSQRIIEDIPFFELKVRKGPGFQVEFDALLKRCYKI